MAGAECNNSFDSFDNLDQEMGSRDDGMLNNSYLSKQWENRMHELDCREIEVCVRKSSLCHVLSITRTLLLQT